MGDIVVPAIGEPEILQQSLKIIAFLVANSGDLTEEEKVKYIYNNAVEDCANFIKDLVPHNPQFTAPLISAEANIRHWMTLR